MSSFQSPTAADIRAISDKLGYRLTDEDVATHVELYKQTALACQSIYEVPEPTLPTKYPRLPGYQPTAEDDPLNAWAWRCHIQGAAGGILAGKRIAIKDNTCVAGIPMMNGGRVLEGFIPEQDATIVSRILDAGATIVGKSRCEDHCISGSSWHCAYGPTRNPLDPSRTTGGSSSGSAALVAAGEVDMATGTDQGGSTRLPASMCGIVGMKPTFGLVPYTGLLPIETTVDHVGPMARNVEGVALLLQAMAGYDNGTDCRQPDTGFDVPKFSQEIHKPVDTFKLGVLSEAFPGCNGDVLLVVESAIEKVKASGRFAQINDVSAPFHRPAATAVFITSLYGMGLQGINANGFGVGAWGMQSSRLSDAQWRGAQTLSRTFSHPVKQMGMISEFLRERYGLAPYHRAKSLIYGYGLKYDELLDSYDALLLPTLPSNACEIPDKDASLLGLSNS